MSDEISKRKTEHLEIIREDPEIDRRKMYFGDVRLIHRALPEMALDEIDPSIEIMGKRLAFPLLISSMTGGSDDLARALLENALGFAVSASEPERYFIEGTYSDMIERDQEAACQSYRKLAELFPEHYFAAMNAAHVCGTRLGQREDAIRWSTRAASHTGRIDANWRAARLLIFLAKDFERARHHVEWLSARAASGAAPQGVLLTTDVFRAEELLAGGRLHDVSAELARIESSLAGVEPSLRPAMARNLTTYHLALGRLRKAEDVGREAHYPGVLPAWLAYLRGDRAAFAEHMQAFLAWLERAHE